MNTKTYEQKIEDLKKEGFVGFDKNGNYIYLNPLKTRTTIKL